MKEVENIHDAKNKTSSESKFIELFEIFFLNVRLHCEIKHYFINLKFFLCLNMN